MTWMRVSLLALLVALGSGGAEANAPVLKPGAPVDYSRLAFQPETWKAKGASTMLLPWHGEKIVFLTTCGDYDGKLMARWVRALDDGWKLYTDLTGATPSPFKQLNSKATIAAVPDFDYTCGAGCGYLGATGIELAMFYKWNYPDLQKNSNAIPHYVFYEMGRNFYTFGDRHSCFTTGFAVFMRYVCMDAMKCDDNDLATRRVIENAASLIRKSDMPFLRTFTMADGLDEKAPRLKDEKGNWIVPSDQPVTYASAMLRLRRENGGDKWVRAFFRALASAPTISGEKREGALQQSWSWLLCASIAAEKDLSPVFVDEWRLPLSKATRTGLGKVDWAKPGRSVSSITREVAPEWDLN